MKTKLYIECNSGISGDMMVASLIDLGINIESLKNTLSTLSIEGYKIEINRVKKAGIDCCNFNVELDSTFENHDHDMNYLHNYEITHTNSVEHHHTKEHSESLYHHHHHEHRGLEEIVSIIRNSKLTDNAKEIAIKIFYILAEAEAKAHGLPIDKVHFHEVGAVDSIIDIAAVAICIDELNITDVIFSTLFEGTGTIRCQHGILSIPVPAVVNIISSYDIPIHFMNVQGEFVTPTGAAIVAALRSQSNLPEVFTIKKIGVGAGKRTYERPSILRAMIIEEDSTDKDCIYKLESNIDDCSGEVFGYLMDKLFENGAKDVYYSPIFMKKNRPAWQLNVICSAQTVEKLEKIIFLETTTIGIRRQKITRTVLERETDVIETRYGEIQIKKCKIDTAYRIYPEYDSIVAASKKYKVPYLEIYNEVIKYGK